MVVTALLLLVPPVPSGVIVGPLPGRVFERPASLETTRGLLELDQNGTAVLNGDPKDSTGLQFLTAIEPSGAPRLYYFPKDYRLVSWEVQMPASVRAPRRADVHGQVLTARADESWRTAQAFAAVASAGRSLIRIALPAGEWKVALVLRGYSPIVLAVRVGNGSVALPASSLSTAVTIRARFRDAKSGAVVSRWTARLRMRGPATDVSALLLERPIAENEKALEFFSVPPGRWDLVVEGSNGTYIRKSLSANVAESALDMGDLFFSQRSGLKVALSFPEAVPAEALSLDIFELLSRDQRGQLLDHRQLKSAPEILVASEQIAADAVLLVLEARDAGLFVQKTVELTGGAVTEVSLTLRPIELRGTVVQGSTTVSEAKVQLGRNGRVRSAANSGSDGRYKAILWAPGLYTCVTETADGSPVFELIDIPEGVTEFDHDVQVPSGRIVGTVSDAASGLPVGGADVSIESRTGAGATSQHSTFGVTTDENGRFEASNLSDVPLSISVSAPHYATARVSGVMPSLNGTAVSVTLRRGERVRGRVVDEAGNPITQAYVGIDPVGYDYVHFAHSGASGEFELADLEAGRHTFVTQQCGYRISIREEVVAQTESDDPTNTVPVTIVLDAGVHPITIHLEKDGKPAGGVGLSFQVEGTQLPVSPMITFARRCGYQTSSDAWGDLRMDYLPDGMLNVYLPDGTPLGSFRHDGSTSVWRVALP